MKKTLWLSYLLSLTFLFNSISSHATSLTPESVKGIYHLGTPERGQSKVEMAYGDMRGTTVIAVAACPRCPPAVYSYLTEESDTLGVPVFTTSGLYLFQYNTDSFVIVQPDAVLGRKIWSKIGHANIYSKNANTAKATSREQIEEFVVSLSNKIMSQETGKMAHGAGTYYLAMPVSHSGRPQTTYDISFISDEKKQIAIKPCDKCSPNQYEHLPEESAIAGVDVYRYASSNYLFDLKDGVLLSTFSNASGLGKTLWGKNSHYNVFSNNQAYIRQILASKEKQTLIDTMMSEYFSTIKIEFEKRAEEARQEKVANRKLPSQGLDNPEQKTQALSAAKRWASAWAWKETLNDAYFTSNDWSITRNRLTGVITGKVIAGIVTMTHPDGRCRFQHVGFRQDYDGSAYMNLHMTSVGPVYDLKCSA